MCFMLMLRSLSLAVACCCDCLGASVRVDTARGGYMNKKGIVHNSSTCVGVEVYTGTGSFG